MTTLYVDSNFYSPYALSAFVAAVEKGIPFTLQTVDLARPAAERGNAFVQTSLTSRVPSLEHEGFTLSESSAIAEYIDEAFEGPRLYPADPRLRARARMVQAWIRSDLMALRKERSSHGVFDGFGPTAPLSDDARLAADKLLAGASALLAQGGEHLCGAWSIADTDLAMMLMRLAASREVLSETLLSYTRRQWSRPSVQRWLEQGGHQASRI
jgi:glutathione S-transferase